MAETIAHAVKFDGNLVWDTSKADGQYKKTADNSKLRELLPDFEFTPLAKGIQETVEWCETNATF